MQHKDSIASVSACSSQQIEYMFSGSSALDPWYRHELKENFDSGSCCVHKAVLRTYKPMIPTRPAWSGQRVNVDYPMRLFRAGPVIPAVTRLPCNAMPCHVPMWHLPSDPVSNFQYQFQGPSQHWSKSQLNLDQSRNEEVFILLEE